MASNRMIRPVIVTCLLSVAVVLGGCSPPLPKTWLPPLGGTMPIDTSHAMTTSPLSTLR